MKENDDIYEIEFIALIKGNLNLLKIKLNYRNWKLYITIRKANKIKSKCLVQKIFSSCKQYWMEKK